VPDDAFKVHIFLFTFFGLIFRDLYTNVSSFYRKSRMVAYNWQPSHKLATTKSICVTNINIEITNARIDRVSHCYSERTKFCFVSIKNESQQLSTRRKTRLVQKKKVHHTTSRLSKVGTYLYIPEAVGSVWFMNKTYILSPIEFKQTLSIPLNMRCQERIGYMI
jgi:hypothetical protein